MNQIEISKYTLDKLYEFAEENNMDVNDAVSMLLARIQVH